MLEILLVDDEPALRDIGKYYLENREEFQVELAEDGEQALEMILARPFSVIISDYDMPNMNGIELLRSVKKKMPDQPFIIFTGKGREEVVIEALNLGADFYLQKGGEIKSQYTELAHKCRRAAERKASSDQINHLARLYSFLSSVNKCVYSMRKKEEFIHEITNVAVDKGGFCLTLVTLTNEQQGHPDVIAFGKSDQCHDVDEIIKNRDLHPVRYAHENSLYHICADHRTYPHSEEEKALYLRGGILSSAAFPILIGEKKIGSITFHSCEPAFFNEEEVLLLLEITETLSIGFELMDKDYEQEKLEENLKIAWSAIDASLTPILLLDYTGKIIYGNSSLLQYFYDLNKPLKGQNAITSGLITPSEWERICTSNETGENIERDINDTYKREFRRFLSVRTFEHQRKRFFWIRFEKSE